MPQSHRAPRRGVRFLRAATMVAALAAVSPATAGADSLLYFNSGSIAPGVSGRVGDSTRAFLDASYGLADSPSHQISAGAHRSGGLSLYAGWVTTLNAACHNYNQTPSIGAMIENPHTVTQSPVSATSGWYGTSDWYC